jgi:hypothetical protein
MVVRHAYEKSRITARARRGSDRISGFVQILIYRARDGGSHVRSLFQ